MCCFGPPAPPGIPNAPYRAALSPNPFPFCRPLLTTPSITLKACFPESQAPLPCGAPTKTHFVRFRSRSSLLHLQSRGTCAFRNPPLYSHLLGHLRKLESIMIDVTRNNLNYLRGPASVQFCKAFKTSEKPYISKPDRCFT